MIHTESSILALHAVGGDATQLRFDFTDLDGEYQPWSYQYTENQAESTQRGIFNTTGDNARPLRLTVTKYIDDDDARFELDDGSATLYGYMSIPIAMADRLFELGPLGPYQPENNNGNKGSNNGSVYSNNGNNIGVWEGNEANEEPGAVVAGPNNASNNNPKGGSRNKKTHKRRKVNRKRKATRRAH